MSKAKKMLIQTKVKIVTVEATINRLTENVEILVQEAIDKKKIGDKRGAVQAMFKRRLSLRQIEKYKTMFKKLIVARDQLVILLI